jgi:hypothetical protein
MLKLQAEDMPAMCVKGLGTQQTNRRVQRAGGSTN